MSTDNIAAYIVLCDVIFVRDKLFTPENAKSMNTR